MMSCALHQSAAALIPFGFETWVIPPVLADRRVSNVQSAPICSSTLRTSAFIWAGRRAHGDSIGSRMHPPRAAESTRLRGVAQIGLWGSEARIALLRVVVGH